ncbi:fimbrial protein [Pseudomonas sp. 3A(2025)]
MKSSKRLVLRCLAVAMASQASWVMAHPTDDCHWAYGGGPMVLVRNTGTVYVPRDAAPGAIIGQVDVHGGATSPPNEVHCWNILPSTRTLEFHARATAPIFPSPLPPINGEDVTGKVLQTNIPGIGVRIKLLAPYDGTSGSNAFIPTSTPTVPFSAERPPLPNMLVAVRIAGAIHRYTLIKTGPIAPGPHQLDGSELVSGYVTTLDKVWGLGLTGTVIQAQCSVGVNPVSADPVQLGEWDTSDFTGPGFTTTAVPFSIALSNCEADASGGNVATAHIRLDGINGSQPVGPAGSGVFSLTTDSIAAGMGIQVLKADGITPVALNTDVPILPVTPGNVALHFNARFYQTAATRDLRPGLAKGALSFTVTYK